MSKFTSLWMVAMCLTISSALTGCGAGGPGSSNQAMAGQACSSSDPNHMCLAIDFVSYTDSSGKATATADQAAGIVAGMNKIWSQCNISFEVENYKTADPAQFGLNYGAASQSETDKIRQTFGNNSELLAVTTGPWGTAVNAWTAMPGENTYGAVMESGIVGYGNGVIYAHEFGHYLGLDHVGDPSNLMDAIVYTDSLKITADQCNTARNVASTYWSAMLRA